MSQNFFSVNEIRKIASSHQQGVPSFGLHEQSQRTHLSEKLLSSFFLKSEVFYLFRIAKIIWASELGILWYGIDVESWLNTIAMRVSLVTLVHI